MNSRLAYPCALLIVLSPSLSYAAVTNLRHYRLGEIDPVKAPLGPGDNPTKDSSSPPLPLVPVDAEKIGLTFYHGQDEPMGATSLGLAVGSSWSMRFTNIDSRYRASAVGGLVDNFGIEAYVQVQDPTRENRFFYNGHTGDFAFNSPLARGAGLGVSGGQFVGIVGDSPSEAILNSGVVVTPGKPTHMALVRDGGIWKIYINHLLVNSFALPAPTGTIATDSLSIGNFFDSGLFPPNPPNFQGVVDEARIFQFLPGAFDDTTDLGPAVIPEPTTLALLALAVGVPILRRSARALSGSKRGSS